MTQKEAKLVKVLLSNKMAYFRIVDIVEEAEFEQAVKLFELIDIPDDADDEEAMCAWEEQLFTIGIAGTDKHVEFVRSACVYEAFCQFLTTYLSEV